MKPKFAVLLVEDEPLITYLFGDILEDSEFVITAAMTCSQPVLEHLASTTPDIAIVDFHLEDGPCLDVVERLAELKIITLIVSAHDDGRAIALSKGWPFVAKPFTDQRLLKELRAVCRPE